MNTLSLEQWREVIGYNPWHFWGLYDSSLAPVTSACNSLVMEYSWQSADAAGRNDIREKIEIAEARLSNYMNYNPAPTYHIETLQMPRYPNDGVERRGFAGSDQRWMTVQPKYGKIIQAGVETRDLIEANISVVVTDLDNDGLEETFTVTFNTTVTDTDQIELQFSSNDRFDGSGAGERWAIGPVQVSISGGVATVRGKRWLLVKPVLYQGVLTDGLEISDGNFAATVDAYRHYCNPAGTSLDTCQAKLIWETRPYPFWALSEPIMGSDPASLAFAIARVGIRDSEIGLLDVGQSTYDSNTGTWSSTDWRTYRPPDRVEVRYYAGVPRQNGKMEVRQARLITALATAELTRRICACDNANRELGHWQFDLAYSGAGQETYGAISAEDLNNPWGTRRGQVYAFKELKGARILRGFSP